MKFINYPRYGKRGWRHWMPSIKQVLSIFLAFLFTVIGVVAYAYANTDDPAGQEQHRGRQPDDLHL